MANPAFLAAALQGSGKASKNSTSPYLAQALKDMSAGAKEPIRGGVGELTAKLMAEAILGRKAQQAADQQKATTQAAWDQVTPLFGGYQDGPAVQVQAPAGPQAQTMNDPSAAIAQATSQIAPGPPQAPAEHTYAPPTKVAAAPINDPRWGHAVASLQQAGVDPSHILDWAKIAQPDIQFAPNGEAIDKHDGGAAGRVFANRQNVNNTIVDMNDAGNTNRAIPDAPVKGAMPVYDNLGHVTDWSLPQGAQGAIGQAAAAQSQGSAEGSSPYDFISVPGPDGRPHVVSKSIAKNGSFAGQSPGDTTYGNDVAKAAAEQYQGMQTAGQKAPGLIAQYQHLGDLLSNVDGGKLTPAGKEIASYANSLGIKLDPNLPNMEASQAITNQLALSLRDPANGGGMPGAMSDADRNFLMASVPNLAQSAQGRAAMIKYQVATLQRSSDVAAKARQWQQRFGRIDAPDATGKTFQDYLQGWANAHPLFTK